MRKFLLFFVPFFVVASLVNVFSDKTTQETKEEPPRKPLVVATIEPLRLLANELYGDQVETRTLLQPAQNPHHANLSTAQLLLIKQAGLLIWLGEQAEPLLAEPVRNRTNGTLALLKVVPPDALVEDHHNAEDHAIEDHATEGQATEVESASGHHHGALDPHLWTDPQLMQAMLPDLVAQGVRLGLPEAALRERADMLAGQLERLVADVQQQLQAVKNVGWLSYHHPWRYFQQRVGLADPLIMVAQPGGDVSSRRFVALAEQMQRDQVHCVMVEPEARVALIKRICQQVDCRIVSLDPLARDRQVASYSEWWRMVGDEFARCLAD